MRAADISRACRARVRPRNHCGAELAQRQGPWAGMCASTLDFMLKHMSSAWRVSPARAAIAAILILIMLIGGRIVRASPVTGCPARIPAACRSPSGASTCSRSRSARLRSASGWSSPKDFDGDHVWVAAALQCVRNSPAGQGSVTARTASSSSFTLRTHFVPLGSCFRRWLRLVSSHRAQACTRGWLEPQEP